MSRYNNYVLFCPGQLKKRVTEEIGKEEKEE
jgi:hypothetical protein